MTKEQALYAFYNSFNIPAYPASAVPEKAETPYITYESITSRGGADTFPAVNIFYRTESEKKLTDKANEITKYIGECKAIQCDEGALYVYFDGVWNPISDPGDATLKRRYTTLKITFNTK